MNLLLLFLTYRRRGQIQSLDHRIYLVYVLCISMLSRQLQLIYQDTSSTMQLYHQEPLHEPSAQHLLLLSAYDLESMTLL